MKNLKTTLKAILVIASLINCGESGDREISLKPTQNTKQDEIISGYAEVNGLKMYYEIHGEGRPLVLIHGGGSTIQTTFGQVIDGFSKNHRVIAVEMQAHGHTADIDRPLSFEQDAADIAALLDYLAIEKADVFGFSNGASTALWLAIRQPGKVNKIIIGSTFFRKDGAPSWFWDMMSHPSFDGMPLKYKEAFLAINNDSTALHRMYERDVARMQNFPDLTEDMLKSVKAPSLIIIGNADVVTPEHALLMHRLLTNSKLVILPGGHGDYIGEISTVFDSSQVKATISMVNKFLETDEVTGVSQATK